VERGTIKSLRIRESSSQSRWSDLRGRGAGYDHSYASSMVMGTWSVPVERREVSHPLTKGRSEGLANARSITEGHAFPERGNLMYTPWEFNRAKAPNAANSKYRADEETSWDEKWSSGSARGFVRRTDSL